jgi:hypothetical protein
VVAPSTLFLMGVHQPGWEMRQGGVPQPPVGEHLLFQVRV